MKNWTEIYTALAVARSGTVSKAADALGVHRATVNRHIDTLEADWGVRLFLRHRRGYALTDTGQAFLQVAARAHDMLDAFAARVQMQNSELEGEVIVTTLFPLTSLILPAIFDFRRQHPRTRVTVHTDEALLQLEKAEAHIALRVGRRPTHDDYVVQPFCTLKFALYAHESYIARHGLPDGGDLTGHLLVGNPNPESLAPFDAWLGRNVDPAQVVLRTANPKVIEDTLCRGEAMGFLPTAHAALLSGLEVALPPRPEWRVQSWLVTHVDVHRTATVQSMLACLKAMIQVSA